MIRRLPFLLLWLGALAAGPAAAEDPAEAPPPQHDAWIRLDPQSGHLAGEDKITVAGRKTLVLYLNPGLKVETALIDGEAVELEQERPLQVPLPDEGSHEVTLRYAGRLDQDPGRAFLDERGAFLPAGSGWLPETAEPRLRYRLRVLVPPPYRAVATGSLVQETEQGGSRVAVFTAERALEPPSLFAGVYEVADLQRGDTLLRTYFPPEAKALAPTYLENAGRYIEALEARIGPYPYEAFHVVAGPLPVGLGFPGLTYISERILRLPFMQTRSLAHEIAHSWWGNGIGVDYESGNWAEGLTTFMADYALANAQGAAAAREMRLGWLRDYAALPKEQDWPVVNFVSKTHDAQQVIGYNKAAHVFHMLEQELTPEVFTAGLRGFWKSRQFSVAGWQDLQSAFEEAAGKDLSWFFSQWLTRPGAPRLHLESAGVEKLGQGYRLQVRLRQDRPSYRLAVPLHVETAEGETRLTLEMTSTTAEGSFDLESAPKRVSVDGDYDLFRRLAPEEATPIFRDITLNSGTRVMTAVGENAEAAQAAEDLTARLVPRPPEGTAPAGEAAAEDPETPLLVVGLEKELPAVLAKLDLPSRPKVLEQPGSAKVWTRRRPDGGTAMIVAARDAESLAVLLRPLPHYRRYGYVVFKGSKAVDKGVWPPQASPLVKDLK